MFWAQYIEIMYVLYIYLCWAESLTACYKRHAATVPLVYFSRPDGGTVASWMQEPASNNLAFGLNPIQGLKSTCLL